MATTVINFTTGQSGQFSESHQQTGASGSVLWDAIYDGSGDGSSLTVKSGWIEGENWDVQMWRSVLSFDTSVLNGAEPITAKIRVSGTQSWRNVSESSQFGSSTVSTYSALKTTTDYVELPIQGSGAGVGSQGFTDVELDLTGDGLANIDPDGTSNFSFRGTGDTTDRGTTVTDQYTHVVITAASLVITHNPIIIFEESVSMGEVFEKDQEKIFSESLSMGEDFLIDGVIPGRTFFESVSIGQTFGQTFTKTLTDSIIAVDGLRKFINGVLVSKWAKIQKDASSWVEDAKEESRWRKTPKK